MRRFFMLGISILFGVSLTAYAQATPPALLVTITDPQSGDVQIAWVDLAAGTHRLLARFSSGSTCAPQYLPEDDVLLYEPEVFGQMPYVYQVNLQTGAALPYELATANNWHCPAFNPARTEVAWLQESPEQTSLLLTTPQGTDPARVATHDDLLNLQWSPTGDALAYTALSDDDPLFRDLIIYTDGNNQSIWPRTAGLVADYVWVPESDDLIVAYWTQDHAIVGRLEAACWAQTETCTPTILAEFPHRTTPVITSAFANDGSALFIILEDSRPDGSLVTNIYQVDVLAGGAQSLTASPDLYKSGLVGDDQALYFVGTRFNAETFAFEDNALYRLVPGQDVVMPVYQAEDFFPLDIIRLAR